MRGTITSTPTAVEPPFEVPVLRATRPRIELWRGVRVDHLSAATPLVLSLRAVS
jgi:hypothetical protein